MSTLWTRKIWGKNANVYVYVYGYEVRLHVYKNCVNVAALLHKANINWAPVHLTERAGLREILLLVEEDWELQTTRQEAEQRSKEAHWQQGSYTIYMYVIIAIVVTSQHVYVSPMTSLADDRHVERSHSSSSAQPPATGSGEKGGWRGRASRRRVSLNLPIPLFCLRQKD